ncbi:MAG: TetM/TetW/TetO/TetS family tetracycline resistance ribosomal protection protein [Eubacterium sp.]|nr:TetM/TetW/TetO/TetS family tetracycline resistance ribosomal protection protein [Eubacterium sp.]
MNKTVIGILAHVDAGKTTLSERLLYECGSINKLGRVDKGDAFLDTHSLEKDRGITIFSKQALLSLGDLSITLLDTPGHLDFSSETEKTLPALDAAILVVSASDGVQGHTVTLWNLLKYYDVPTFIFVNKTDMPGASRSLADKGIKKYFGDSCICLSDEDADENIALCDEALMERYLAGENISAPDIKHLIKERKLFPVYYGSALKGDGIEEFLSGLKSYLPHAYKGDTFGARVFKISRDEQGTRLTHAKIESGQISVKELIGEEKLNQIRIYNGVKYENVNTAEAGDVVCFAGLNDTYAGDGLGICPHSPEKKLSPVLSYEIILPEGLDPMLFLPKLKMIEEENPELCITWNEDSSSISALLMGDIQIEILKSLISERFGTDVTFGKGRILYKETIANTVEGVGHFEPYRHYAEVHLLMSPLPAGSGLLFDTDVTEDELAKNWQRLILTHLKEKNHRGVLTGSFITDMKITLVGGRAHNKHTEGGDFRKATYRAVRQGLMQAENVLLEPFYEIRMEMPSTAIGRVMTDIEQKCGHLEPPEIFGDTAYITGSVPVSTLADYQKEFLSFTGGMGKMSLALKGYYPCHNTEEVLADSSYDPERDTKNPSSSVFVSGGETLVVPWDEVKNYMHVESVLSPSKPEANEGDYPLPLEHTYGGEQELLEIFQRTYGYKGDGKAQNLDGYFLHNYNRDYEERKKRSYDEKPLTEGHLKHMHKKEKPSGDKYLLVDGYNIIFAWDELKALAASNMDSARDKLQDIMSNYQGFTGDTVIIVYDAYRVPDHGTSVQKVGNIHIVFTKTAETADQFIEKLAIDLRPKHRVIVATSDGIEQVIVMSQGCELFTAPRLHDEIISINNQIKDILN